MYCAARQTTDDNIMLHTGLVRQEYRGADKSLARPGRKQAGPVKSVMGRGVD